MPDSSFGYFQNDGREFVVTEPRTPRPLTNYFWNDRFISGIGQHGGGAGTYKERPMQYIDPRGRALMVREGARHFYLRDAASGEAWSPGWHPVGTEVEAFSCTHGLGYSVIESQYKGIAARLRVFVGADHPCEIWTVTLSNRRNQPAEVQLFTFVDWLLQGYTVYSDYFAYLHGEWDAALKGVVSFNEAVERPHGFYNGFVASSLAPAGFDTARRAFVGPYGYASMPAAVAEGRCGGSLAECECLCGALEHRLTLPAGAAESFHVYIGATDTLATARAAAASLSAEGAVEAQVAAVRERMDTLIDRLRVETPEARTNFLINGWIKRQIQLYAEVGSDNGRGFRDAMQLIWATASYDPPYTRGMLPECLQHQFADGHTLRGWLPIDEHHYSDGPVWIAPVIDAYLKETADTNVLDLEVPYFDAGSDSVWGHLMRGLRHSSDDLGPHGLVRCHFGDWNDSLTGIGMGGKGESVWTSIAIVYALKLAAGIAERARQNTAERDELLERAETLARAVHEHAWDGQWYLRAINDAGRPVGSAAESEGRIWLNPQVWAILAGIVDDDRREQLYRVIDEHLETDHGSKTLHPAYTRHDPGVGRVSALRPGIWENGTAYCHANGFKVIADCLGGRGDRAWASFQKALPDGAMNPSTHSGCEPYAMTNMYLGPESRRAGQTQFAWMTGTAGWYYRALSEHILGVRADWDGLRVAPCLPSHWPAAKLTRTFRGARYRIEIQNPDARQSGPVQLTVDGRAIEGNLVPAFDDGGEHKITARL